MSISENIAKYRKQKSFTQEQLGERLGVSNQAVSKWESGVSLPDVMLLPKIAEALGITLEQLYGIEANAINEPGANDTIYKSANKAIISLLYDKIGHLVVFPNIQPEREPERYESEKNPLTHKIDQIKDNRSFKLYSEDGGYIYISGDVSVVDTDFKLNEVCNIFKNRETVSIMKRLSDSNVNKVMAYMTSKVFNDKETCRTEYHCYYQFMFDDIANDCNLSEDDLLTALDRLISLKIVEKSSDGKETKYVLYKPKAIQFAVLLKNAERLACETNGFGWDAPESLACNYMGLEEI